jgi:hypothetical protein
MNPEGDKAIKEALRFSSGYVVSEPSSNNTTDNSHATGSRFTSDCICQTLVALNPSSIINSSSFKDFILAHEQQRLKVIKVKSMANWNMAPTTTFQNFEISLHV